jgi:glutathionyl-hydroquinone reductase
MLDFPAARVQGFPVDEEAFKEDAVSLIKVLEVLDKILAKQKYMAGDVSLSGFEDVLQNF